MKIFIRKIKDKFKNIKLDIWNIYIINTDIFWRLFSQKNITLSSIKGASLIHIKKAPGPYIIAADPYFISEKIILFESIARGNGNGCIFKYDLSTERYFKLDLDNSLHYSFPRSFKYNGNTYLTFECHNIKGVCIYLVEDLLSLKLKKVSTDFSSEDKKYRIIDPIIKEEKDGLELRCSCLESQNREQLVFFADNHRADLKFKLKKRIILSDCIQEIKGKTMRSAGGELVYQNKDYLPMQMHRDSYGDGVWLFQEKRRHIDQEETVIKVIDRSSERCCFGPHTINYSPNREYIALDLCFKDIQLFYLKIYWLLIKYFSRVTRLIING
ncbi:MULTISPECIES: hypothetical protein [Prochlorococcus]|uniref:hypothetical protein n=1 Tax=Prochlorococcus TaxID=1218 RepID=UPI000533B9C7|nr:MULTISPECIES: hypothetical protein [Prochlorococcus]KGG12042.1 hypothetical protein EV05_1245 [Prochlorococcus sp. MIT 0601]